MSDLVERVARALAKEGGIQICDDATYALSSYRGPALAAIAAMQTDAAPALKPAVEVWRKAVYDYGGASIEGVEAEYRAAAVIEADRAAIIAAKDAEIAALQAHADALAEELRQIEVDAMEHYNDWMEHGCEKVEATRFVFDLGEYAREALRAYEELSRD